MLKDYQRLFKMTPQEEVPAHLFENINLKILHHQMLRFRVTSTIHSLIICAAIVAQVPAMQYLAKSMTLSGFSDYLSMITSDASTVIGHWREYTMSLVDSLPVTEIIIVGALVLIFVNSLRLLLRDKYLLQSNKAILRHA